MPTEEVVEQNQVAEGSQAPSGEPQNDAQGDRPSKSLGETTLEDYRARRAKGEGTAPEPESPSDSPKGEKEEAATGEVKEGKEEETKEVETKASKDDPPPISRAEKRIKDLNSKYREEQRRADAAEARIKELEGKEAPEKTEKTETSVDPEDPEPKEGDFDSFEEFQREVRAWDRRQAKREAIEEIRKEDRKKAEAEAQRQAEERWNQSAESMRESHPDFDDVIADLKVSPAVANIVTAISDKGAELAYYLAKNPDEANRIVNMEPVAAVYELGKIEEKLQSNSEGKSSAEPKNDNTVTRTPGPKPINPVKSGGSGGLAPLEKASLEDYRRRRAAGEGN